MSLRKFLLVPLLISVALFVYYSSEVRRSYGIVTATIEITPGLCAAIATSIVLQLAGHVVRAYKARLLLSPVKESTPRFQFRALSIGYLFNTVLPFRLGELVRARIISGAEMISFSYALTLIIIERALDALLIGVLGLLLILAGFVGPSRPELLAYVVALAVTAVAIFNLLRLLKNQNLLLVRAWYRLTQAFNDSLKNSFRFKLWSIIYGLGQTLKPRIVSRYISLTLLSWLLYAASMFSLVHYFFPYFDLGKKAVLTIAPYYGVAIPSGPANLGIFSKASNSFTHNIGIAPDRLLVFNLLVWAVLVLPIALLGLSLLFVKTKETLWQNRPRHASEQSLINKLSRQEDISNDMAAFLENYFSGNTLSRIVHRLEQQDDFRLIKYFKGGSDAITILALQNGRQIVKKIIPLEFEDRLKAQYDWLAKRRKRKGIVQVLGEERGDDYYAINLAYDPSDVMLFDFMHRNQLAESQKIMDQVWNYLTRHVYGKPSRLQLHKEEREAYVEKHIFGCLDKAMAVNGELLRAAQPERLRINGKEYDNLYQIIEKIRSHPRAWKDIATYRETVVVHGDVAVDNILVTGKGDKALLIDPAPDGNIINGLVFDFGKNMQALYCGYEFMLRDEEPVFYDEAKGIEYRDNTSAQYKQLCAYVRDSLAPQYLSDAERKAIIFHAAALHIRRLKHQVYFCPANTLKFYAIGVKTFNEFLSQYE